MEQKPISIFIDYAPTINCRNPDSYGEVCVKCNRCGRFREKTIYDAKINNMKEKLLKEEDDGV